MSIKKVSTDNGIKVEGFINIEIFNKKDHITRVYKNTITNCGKQFLLDKCAQQMLSMSADIFGNTLASGVITRKGTAQSSSNVTGRVAYASRDITNVLLNLGEEVTLNGATTHINVWDANYALADKLVGYANNNIVPTADGKEGAVDYTKGEYVIDPYTTAKRWKYAEGIASGTIDTIAMMPAASVKQPNGDGVRFMKCIDKINSQYINFASRSTGMLPPGISGYTANDEVLLNFNKDSKNRWKFNLTTGEMTEVASGDPFFVVLQTDSGHELVDIKKDGNYLYVLRLTAFDSSYTQVRVQVYDMSVTPTPTLVTTFTGNTSSQQYICNAKFLMVGSQMYITLMGTTNSSTESPDKIYTLNKGSNPYWSSAGNVDNNFNAIGVTVPSGLNIRQICFGNYGSNYVMYLYTPIADVSGEQIGFKSKAYVFTSLTNLDPDVAIDCIFGMNPNSILWYAGSNGGVIQVGFDKMSSLNTTTGGGQSYDLYDAVFQVNNNSIQVTNTLGRDGIFISMDKWWTNAISFVRLQTPIVKGDSDIMYVSYGYKVV